MTEGKTSGPEKAIRFAEKEDIPAIMDFIENQWGKGHILAHDRELFDFQYVYGEEVCFVLSENPESGEIESLLGYIPYDTRGERDMFSAIWKAGRSGGFLQGMELIRFLEQNGRCRNLYGVGLASGAVSTMKYLRKKIAEFEHYYMLNPAVRRYRIAEIRNGKDGPIRQGDMETAAVPADAGNEVRPAADTPQIRQITEYETVADMLARCQAGRAPYKSPEFIKRRYFAHPEYEYEKWYIGETGGEALLVCRVQEAEGGSVYRVIDLIGDVSCMAYAGEIFIRKMEEEGHEYADCLVCGIDEAVMGAAGFVKKTEEDGNIIPNYFEPFEKRNITIRNYMPKEGHAVMFKGDGDQDRPNFRKKGKECGR